MGFGALNDLYWAAGFLDGEGSFIFTNPNHTACIQAGQKGIELLLRLKKMFGGSICTCIGGINKNRYFKWSMQGIGAAGVMMTLYTLMSQKRQEQIKKTIALWKTYKPHSKYRTHCPKGHEYSLENTYIRADGKRKCKQCNREYMRIYNKTYYEKRRVAWA